MSQAPLPPGVERRRQLRLQRRNERLRNVWRLLLLSAGAAGLGYGLLRQGWSLRGPDQVLVIGSEQVSREEVIRAAQLRFPLTLLSLQPRELKDRLAATLPVEQVGVQRLMLPPRLRIDLVDRQAVAMAERRTPAGLQRGCVDRLGNWMNCGPHQLTAKSGGVSPSSLLVLGWQPAYRAPLAQVLAEREQLGGNLSQIRFEPTGTIVLLTRNLGEVRLGPPDGQLTRRLEVLEHLEEELPARVKGKPVNTIDLSDPDRPELGLTVRTPASAAPRRTPPTTN
ncbi:FtsQ-type POTRA domain-containing protein [Synechococcus sp. Lug-A]|uniref:cell division protein FtsQ/DivIB n=1 Tax=Synechococcus sp. Lug-A TaxID=2823740 RepID=UPI0020CBBAE8|nr:FtsQ-type POTRA domain-containing protein [Synechococcus sp. Lug-A]